MKTHLWAESAGRPVASPEPTARRRWLGWRDRPGRRGARAAFLPIVVLFALGAVLLAAGTANLVAPAGAATAQRWAVAALAAGVTAVVTGAGCAVAVRRRIATPLARLDALVTEAAGGRAGVVLPGGDLVAMVGAVATLVDDTRRGRRLLAVEERSRDLTVVLEGDGLVGHASPAAGAMLGRPAGWMTGKNLAALVHPEDRFHLDDLRNPAAAGAAPHYEEVRLSHLQGHWVTTEMTAVDPGDHDGSGRLVLNIRDVSDRKAHEQDLVRQALYDPLTGLSNRALFREHVDKALARLRRTPARPHAVLFVDLDGFKTVNDSLGHAAGDEVLAEVGRRLLRWVRPGDTAARLGGDEFAVLLENTSQMDTGILAQRILDVLLAPIIVQGKEVVLTGSIGIALSEPGQDSEALLRNADVAMYTAKAAGKGRFRVFEPEMHHAAMRRLDLEADLRRSISRDELYLAYQPIVDLATNRLTGTEVLVRWQHPERGLIPPLDFISVAEDSGFIREMGRYILERACHQAKAWHDRYPAVEPLRICVNTSVRQIEQTGFYDEVVHALDQSGLDGGCLTLEITESLFMSDLAATVEKLRRLKELGVKLAVDDFGTGYSSLSYLRSLPIDILKIDKSFVVGVTQGPEQSAVARAVVKLARTFNLQTVAEGVERPEQAAELLAIGADMGQGYWFSRPLRAEGMEAFLAASRLVPAPPAVPTRPHIHVAPALPAGGAELEPVRERR